MKKVVVTLKNGQKVFGDEFDERDFKKLKDIFIDSKIDIKKRDEYPILVDAYNNILWIPGLKKSKFDKNFNEFYDIIIKCTEEENEQ